MLRPQDWLGEEESSRIPREKLMSEIPVNRVLAACQEATTLRR
jgi:hypothetical protein